LSPDGPQNLFDAVLLAREPGCCGVLVLLAGRVFAGHEVRKIDSYRLDAFGADAAGPVALMEEGRVRRFRPWPEARPLGLDGLPNDTAAWPRVAVLISHAGAEGALVDALVDALVAAGVRGIVVAGSGNGSVHTALDAALRRAIQAGLAVRRSTRCATGGVVGSAEGEFASAGALSPVQARIELMLELMPCVR
jgi:L-asparaginase